MSDSSTILSPAPTVLVFSKYVLNEGKNGWIDGWMDGWMDGRRDGWWMDGWMNDGWMGGG